MKRTQRILRRCLVVLCSVAVAGAMAGAAPAGGAPVGPEAAPPSSGHDELVAALQRDLNLTAEQVHLLLDLEARAAEVEEGLRVELGASYGGTWLTEVDGGIGELVVGVTDDGLAARVRDAGAVPQLVARSEAELDGLAALLDESPEPVPDSVLGWHVDVAVNQVILLARLGGTAEALDFASRSGAQEGSVTVEETDEDPQPFHDIRGGDAYYPGGRCSVGFAVTGGFVTAGHCGAAGTTTAGFNFVAQGVVAGASFPGNDYGWVRTNTDWTPTPTVNNYNGGTISVAGSRVASRGSSVCRSGSTTGLRCGKIRGKNQTIRYPEGRVRGLTKTTVCAEPGDSGGSFISGNQAQGVTSGGHGNCSRGGRTWFQPVNEILSTYGLTLTTTRANCRGLTWSVVAKDWGRDVTRIGSDFHSNAYAGDTSCDRAMPVACLQPAGLPVPPGVTPTFDAGWTGGNLRLSTRVQGHLLTSRAAADAVCAAQFGAGWRMGEFHDGGGGWSWWAQGDPQRMWVAIDDQSANPWNTGTGRAMTWTMFHHQWGADVVDVGSDFKTNPYSGDTPTSASLPVLCLRQDGRPVPPGVTPTTNNGWAAGEVRLSAPVRGSALTSRLAANLYCLSQFGFGWRMAEFHDGGGGWAYWAAGDIGRMWVAINDQPANPWDSR